MVYVAEILPIKGIFVAYIAREGGKAFQYVINLTGRFAPMLIIAILSAVILLQTHKHRRWYFTDSI